VEKPLRLRIRFPPLRKFSQRLYGARSEMEQMEAEAICDVILHLLASMGLATKGKLAAGYDADLIVFDDDIRVKKVFVSGCLAV